MQFGLDEDQEMIADTVRRFAEAEVGPRARELDEAQALGEASVASLAELGLMGMFVDPELGGGGLDPLGGALVVEELAVHDASLATVVAAHNGQAVLHLAAHAPDALRAEWLPRLAAAEVLAAWAGDAEGVEATAVEDGWRLSGKLSCVPLVERAAGVVVGASTPDGARAFWVRTEDPGVTRAKLSGGLGLRSAGLSALALDGAPAVRLDGPAAPEAVALHGRILFAAICVGVARGSMEQARAYALERKQFNKPIAQFQAIQWKLADVATETDASRLMVHRAAVLAASEDPAAAAAAAQARLLAADTAVKAANEAIQIYGGNGFVREFPVERFLRDAKVLQSGFGAADMMRADVTSAQLAG